MHFIVWIIIYDFSYITVSSWLAHISLAPKHSMLRETLFSFYFGVVGLYDSVFSQLGSFTGSETMPTNFTLLPVSHSAGDYSSTNMRLFLLLLKAASPKLSDTTNNYFNISIHLKKNKDLIKILKLQNCVIDLTLCLELKRWVMMYMSNRLICAKFLRQNLLSQTVEYSLLLPEMCFITGSIGWVTAYLKPGQRELQQSKLTF